MQSAVRDPVELARRGSHRHVVAQGQQGQDDGERDSIKVEGDHADEICEVHLTKPGNEECSKVIVELDAARILLTSDVGLAEPVRRANALGFMMKNALDNCGDTLKAMGFLPVA